MGDLIASSSACDPAPEWRGPVAVITAIQAVLALMVRALPLFGVPLTLAAGVSPAAAGQMAAATSFGSMVFFLWGTAFLVQVPARRQLQGGAILTALAILVCLSGDWQMILLGAFLIGVGYGPSASAGSDLLMKMVPAARRGLGFSIKQAGVPLGGLVAGLLLPGVAIAFGLAAALWLLAGIATAGAIGLAFWRGAASMDDPRPTVSAPRRRPGRAIRDLALAPAKMSATVVRDPRIRVITLAGFGLGIAQGVLLAYYPVVLNDHVGYSLAAAGLAFGLLQGVGIGGRVALGWISDLAGREVSLLPWLCVASGLTMLMLATLGPGASALWVALVSVLAGVSVVSWNGVFMSELASAAPEGGVGAIVSAGTFVIFAGYVVSPIAAQWIFETWDSYGPGLAAAGVAPLAAALMLAATRSRHRPS